MSGATKTSQNNCNTGILKETRHFRIIQITVESGLLHSQLAKLLNAIKWTVRLSEISINKQIGLEFTTLMQ